jgi:hypothetical protein
VVDATVKPEVLRVDHSSPPLDNAFSQFVILANGNLGHLLDRNNVAGFIVPGMDLHQP